MRSATPRRSRRSAKPVGFTLIELMVVMVIIIVLAGIAFTVVNATVKGDKIPGASRTVQAFLEGARDRALHDKQPRGVRFNYDSNNPNQVRSMVYIGPAGKLSEGSLIIGQQAAGVNPEQRRWIRFGDTTIQQTWERLDGTVPNRPVLIFPGARLRIQSNFYTIVRDTTSPSQWSLSRDFIGTLGQTYNAAVGDWDLQLAPTILPNQEPVTLPQGVVIDFAHSQLPATWSANPDRRDLMFSPRGTIIGAEASAGHIHLVVGGLLDADANLAPGDPNKRDGEVIVTVTTQTGAVSSHSVHIGGDPFRYAESGVETE